MKIIVLVGLPGAGKSTLAEEYRKQGYKIHSPDAIRNELHLHSLDDTQKVFDILKENLLADMTAGKNVVYDSTNLTRRRRMKFLDIIKDFDYEKICYVKLTSIDTCKNYNSQRVGYSRVPDREYNIMVNAFSLPMSDEGWDKIILDIQDEKVEIV